MRFIKTGNIEKLVIHKYECGIKYCFEKEDLSGKIILSFLDVARMTRLHASPPHT